MHLGGEEVPPFHFAVELHVVDIQFNRLKQLIRVLSPNSVNIVNQHSCVLALPPAKQLFVQLESSFVLAGLEFPPAQVPQYHLVGCACGSTQYEFPHLTLELLSSFPTTIAPNLRCVLEDRSDKHLPEVHTRFNRENFA